MNKLLNEVDVVQLVHVPEEVPFIRLKAADGTELAYDENVQNVTPYSKYLDQFNVLLQSAREKYYGQTNTDYIKNTGNRTKDNVKKEFAKLDLNGDGLIELSELRTVLVGSKMTEEDVEALFQVVDSNTDGRVSVDEFLDWVFDGNVPVNTGEEEWRLDTMEQAWAHYAGQEPATEGLTQDKFLKVCKDAFLWGRRLTDVAVAEVFETATEDAEFMSYTQFEAAAVLMGERLGKDREYVANQIYNWCGKPRTMKVVTPQSRPRR